MRITTLQQYLNSAAGVRGNDSIVNVGLLPVGRNVFDVEAGKAALNELIEVLNGNPHVFLVLPDDVEYPDNVLMAGADPAEVIDLFTSEGIDLLLIYPVNYGDENIAAAVGKEMHTRLKIPIATYASYDGPPAEDGTRLTDRTCGIWPLRYLLAKWLGFPVDYIPMSNVGDAVFQYGLEKELRVAGAVRSFRRSRILQVGGDQPTFPAIKTNRAGMEERWQIPVESVELMTLIDRILEREANPEPFIGDNWRKLLFAGIDLSEAEAVNENVPLRIALMLYGIFELMEEKSCNAMSIRCWDEIMVKLGVMPCWILGYLNGFGIVAADETDNHGALSMQLLYGASLGEQPAMLLDNTITLDDGRQLNWHCGPASTLTCREGCDVCMHKGWIIPVEEPGCAGYADFKIGELGGKATFCRVNPDFDGNWAVCTYEADIVDGPSTRGSHFWIQPKDSAEFESEMANMPVVHHWGVMLGEWGHVVIDAARWLGIRRYALNGFEEVYKNRDLCRAAREATDTP